METLRARICDGKTHPAGCIRAPSHDAPGRPPALEFQVEVELWRLTRTRAQDRLAMSLTASFFVVEPAEVIVTRRVTFEPAGAVVLTVTLAVTREAAPGASEGVRYVPATTLAVMSVLPEKYLTV
jgi:hypothetical protein